MVKRICDKCGAPVEWNPLANAILPKYRINKYSGGLPLMTDTVDLCKRCEELFEKWLKEKPEPDESAND